MNENNYLHNRCTWFMYAVFVTYGGYKLTSLSMIMRTAIAKILLLLLKHSPNIYINFMSVGITLLEYHKHVNTHLQKT